MVAQVLTALSLARDVGAAIGKGKDAFDAAPDATQVAAGKSMFHSLAPLFIQSRAYIDGDVASLDITRNVLRGCQNLYTSMILTTLNLDASNVNARSMREMLSSVSTETLDSVRMMEDVQTFFALEAVQLDAEDFDDEQPSQTGAEADADYDSKLSGSSKVKSPEGRSLPTFTKGSLVAEDKDGFFPHTREVEVTFNLKDVQGLNEAMNASMDQEIELVRQSYEERINRSNASGDKAEQLQNERDNKILEIQQRYARGKADALKESPSIRLMVQIVPYVIRPSKAHNFINFEAKGNIFKRFLQYKAGEIQFFRDFVFEYDQMEKKKRLMQEDSDGVLRDFFLMNMKKRKRQGMDLWAIASKGPQAKTSTNIASTIVILGEDAVRRAKGETGVDIHDKGDRQAYFKDTLALMVCVVDEAYRTVTIYFNGLPFHGVYPFDSFQPKGKSNDIIDVVKAMSDMAQGRAPRIV